MRVSAWLVSNGHIDVLVNACAEYDVAEARTQPQELGQDLWRENVRSVNYRYSEAEEAPSYRLATTEAPLHPLAILAAIECYQYQACERPDWADSIAYKATEALRSAVLERHPELGREVPSRHYRGRWEHAYRHMPLYDAMPWGFEQLADAEAHRYEGAEVTP